MSKLYEIGQRYRNLEELLDNNDIERGAIQAALSEVEGEFIEKAEAIAKLIKNMNGDIEAFKNEEKRLAERRKTIENNQKRLKEYLDSEAKSIGIDKAKGKIFSFAIQKNAPSLNIFDENLLPEDCYIKQDPVLDRKGLLQRLKDGEVVPGVEIKQTESLRIR